LAHGKESKVACEDDYGEKKKADDECFEREERNHRRWDNKELPNEQRTPEEVKEVLIEENTGRDKKERGKEEEVQQVALEKESNEERRVSRKEALIETFWSLVLITNVVCENVYACMINLVVKVKNKALELKREGARRIPIERDVDEKDMKQVAAVCQEGIKQQLAVEVHCKVPKDE